jgi:hypothetical protein
MVLFLVKIPDVVAVCAIRDQIDSIWSCFALNIAGCIRLVCSPREQGMNRNADVSFFMLASCFL